MKRGAGYYSFEELIEASTTHGRLEKEMEPIDLRR